MNAGKRRFDETRWTLVVRAGAAPTQDSRKAFAELCRAYDAPLQAFARRLETDSDRAKDLLQGFFESLAEPKALGRVDPARGSFRAFLCRGLRNHAYNVYNYHHAVSHGGKAQHDGNVDEVASGVPSAEGLCIRLWVRTLLDRALAQLADEQARAGKGALLEALRDRLASDDDGTTLRETAATLGMSEGAVKVALFRMRRRFFDLARAEVADTVARPEDVDDELRALLEALEDDE